METLSKEATIKLYGRNFKNTPQKKRYNSLLICLKTQSFKKNGKYMKKEKENSMKKMTEKQKE